MAEAQKDFVASVTGDQSREGSSSHKLIEKRRRDRINNCLSELSQIVPAAFAKQTGGKLEKAEILEMTVDYLRAIQSTDIGIRFDHGEWFSCDIWLDFLRYYQAGFHDCVVEVGKYMAEVEGVPVNDARTIRMSTYLQSRLRPDVAFIAPTPTMLPNQSSVGAKNVPNFPCEVPRHSTPVMGSLQTAVNPLLHPSTAHLHVNSSSRLPPLTSFVNTSTGHNLKGRQSQGD